MNELRPRPSAPIGKAGYLKILAEYGWSNTWRLPTRLKAAKAAADIEDFLFDNYHPDYIHYLLIMVERGIWRRGKVRGQPKGEQGEEQS